MCIQQHQMDYFLEILAGAGRYVSDTLVVIDSAANGKVFWLMSEGTNLFCLIGGSAT